MSPVIERILDLVDKSQVKASQILQELELSNSSISDWKKGKAKPSSDAIVKLANYFNVSTDYLLMGTEKKLDLSIDEKEWLQLYHDLPLSERRECVGFVKGYIEHGKKNNAKEKKVVGK